MMAAPLRVFVLTLSTFCGATALLNRPVKVHLTSDNMNLVLRWDPPEGAVSGVVYTTEYKSSATTYRTGCLNTSALECDFTSFNISVYGKYTGRVRAQLGTQSSIWVESNSVTLDKETYIGSPIVALFPNGETLEVSIKDPVFKISTLRNVYSVATYNITYWKKGQNDKAKSRSNIQQTRVVLNDLDPLSQYCVQVQINTDRNPNPGKPSSIICESTTKANEAPWVAAVMVFVSMAVAVTLVVVTVVYWKSISQFLCLKDALSEDFKESLLAPPTSTVYLAMRDSHPVEEVYHQVSIIMEERGPPLEATESSCIQQPGVPGMET